MTKEPAPVDIQKKVWISLVKSLAVPVVLLVFFLVAPQWLNHRLRDAGIHSIEQNSRLTDMERASRESRIAVINFQQVSLDCPSGMEPLHDRLQKAGIVANFQRLLWGSYLSLALVVGLVAAVAAIFSLNRKARRSQADLVRSYRLAWHISLVAALAKVFLLIPLLAYGTFEFSVLLTDHFFPKLLLVIILGGLFALWRSAAVLLKKVPMQFKEPMSREVTPQEAPELWAKVREAAVRLQTEPPDRIIIGIQFNFYVTELAVLHDSGKAEGRTLYLSYPLLKKLSEEEVLAIIGHELGHFIGADTLMTRQFYPLRWKINGTMIALARSGWVGWPSFQLLSLFNWCFNETERIASRARELLADQKAALVTSAQTAGQALLKFQVAAEVFRRSLKEGIQNKAENPLNAPLFALVRDKLAPEPQFWDKLFEKKLPHPLDTHPSLHVRLEALGLNISAAEARAIALTEARSAYDQWLSMHGDLFTDLTRLAEAAVSKLQARAAITEADYSTAAGKELLDRHFPERKWRPKASSFWFLIVLLGLFMSGCLLGVIFIPDAGGKTVFLWIGLIFILTLVGYWIRHRHAELTLNVEGVFHSGWKRPVPFKEVARMFVRRSSWSVTLILHFKTKQPSPWKFPFSPGRQSKVSFSVTGLGEKPLAVAQTFFRYYTRQTEPEQTPAPAPAQTPNKPA